MDHIVIFSFLSLFSVTRLILLWPNRLQVITLHGQDLTICFAAHEPCAHFTYHLYLRLCIYSEKEGSFSTELRLKFISSHRFAFLRLAPLPNQGALSSCLQLHQGDFADVLLLYWPKSLEL